MKIHNSYNYTQRSSKSKFKINSLQRKKNKRNQRVKAKHSQQAKSISKLQNLNRRRKDIPNKGPKGRRRHYQHLKASRNKVRAIRIRKVEEKTKEKWCLQATDRTGEREKTTKNEITYKAKHVKHGAIALEDSKPRRRRKRFGRRTDGRRLNTCRTLWRHEVQHAEEYLIKLYKTTK